MVVAGVMAFLLMGCSQKSDTSAVDANAGLVEVTQPDTAKPDSNTLIELSASTKPLQVADHRPLKIPEITYQLDTSSQTFEIGNDAPLDESSGTRSVALRYRPVNVSGPARFAPTYPERPVPQRGMKKQEVLAAVGTPANQMAGSGTEIWDYGTYRVFFSDDVVAFTRVW